MRYKRVNTLALDVSSLPSPPNNSTILDVLKYLKLDPSKMKSVQIHSSRKTVYFGVPDNLSAAEIAKQHHRGFSIKIEGKNFYMQVACVEEDIIDVRVCDIPPETPNTIIKDALHKYGQVLSVTSEVWKDFFPGALTGVRVARMKVPTSIPSFVPIGNSLALIRYAGQSSCRSCGESSHPLTAQCDKDVEKKQKTKRARKEDPPNSSKSMESSSAVEPKKLDIKKCSDAPAGSQAHSGTIVDGETVGESETTPLGFMTVKRRKGRGVPHHRPEQYNGDTDSSVELDDQQLKEMNETQAQKLSPDDFTRWLTISGGLKKPKSYG